MEPQGVPNLCCTVNSRCRVVFGHVVVFRSVWTEQCVLLRGCPTTRRHFCAARGRYLRRAACGPAAAPCHPDVIDGTLCPYVCLKLNPPRQMPPSACLPSASIIIPTVARLQNKISFPWFPPLSSFRFLSLSLSAFRTPSVQPLRFSLPSTMTSNYLPSAL